MSIVSIKTIFFTPLSSKFEINISIVQKEENEQRVYVCLCVHMHAHVKREDRLID